MRNELDSLFPCVGFAYSLVISALRAYFYCYMQF